MPNPNIHLFAHDFAQHTSHRQQTQTVLFVNTVRQHLWHMPVIDAWLAAEEECNYNRLDWADMSNFLETLIDIEANQN